MKGEVQDELLLLPHMKRELVLTNSEIWLVCWSVPQISMRESRLNGLLNENIKSKNWLGFQRFSY